MEVHSRHFGNPCEVVVSAGVSRAFFFAALRESRAMVVGFSFQGNVWAHGTVDVNVKALTTAILWLAEQLQGETDARHALEARVSLLSKQAVSDAAASDHLANAHNAGEHDTDGPTTAAGGLDGMTASVLDLNTHQEPGIEIEPSCPPRSAQDLERQVQRLEQALSQHRRQQEQKDASRAELVGIQVDAARESEGFSCDSRIDCLTLFPLFHLACNVQLDAE